MHGDDVLRQVGAVDGEHVALLEATPREAGSDAPHRVGEGRVGDRASGRTVYEGGLVTELPGPLEHEPRQRDVGNLDVGVRTAEDHGAPPFRHSFPILDRQDIVASDSPFHPSFLLPELFDTCQIVYVYNSRVFDTCQGLGGCFYDDLWNGDQIAHTRGGVGVA